MIDLRTDMQSQAQDLIGIATGFARTGARVFIQNTLTAAVHYAKPNDDRSTVCGWQFACARKQRGTGLAYRVVPNLRDLPGNILCETCPPTDLAIALDLLAVELGLVSGDDWPDAVFQNVSRYKEQHKLVLGKSV